MRKSCLFVAMICLTFFVKAQDANQSCCPFQGFDLVSDMETALKNPALEILDLSLQVPKLTKAPEALSALTKLKCLNLSFNRIAAFPENFKELVNLECLDLSGNHYLQRLPAFFNQMPKLKVIRIEGLDWTEARKKTVEKTFPKITFIW